jgi:hypothetical protein
MSSPAPHRGTSLLAFERHLLESSLHQDIAHIRQTLSPVEADVAVERLLRLEMLIPTSPNFRLVDGKFVLLQENVDTCEQVVKSGQPDSSSLPAIKVSASLHTVKG